MGVNILYSSVISLGLGVVAFEFFITGVVVACVWAKVCP